MKIFFSNDLYLLETRTMHWTKPQTSGLTPSPRRAHSATVVGTSIYIFGGGDGKNPLNDLLVLDTEKLHWSTITPRDPPQPGGYHTALTYGNSIHIFGGIDMDDVNSCVYGDLSSLVTGLNQLWTKKKIGKQRCFHTTTLIGSWVLIFGGFDGEDYSNELSFFSLADGEFKNVEVLGCGPCPRGFHSAVFYDSRIFFFGGCAGGQTYFNDIYILHLCSFASLSINKTPQVQSAGKK